MYLYLERHMNICEDKYLRGLETFYSIKFNPVRMCCSALFETSCLPLAILAKLSFMASFCLFVSSWHVVTKRSCHDKIFLTKSSFNEIQLTWDVCILHVKLLYPVLYSQTFPRKLIQHIYNPVGL